MQFNYGQDVAEVRYYKRSLSRPFRSFNVTDFRCPNQTFNLATDGIPHSKRFFRSKTCQPRTHIMFMHTALIFILLPQLFCSASNFSRYYFFLIKFKTMGLMHEPDLATKLCSEAYDGSFFGKFLVVKLSGQKRNTRLVSHDVCLHVTWR